jgi:hypothetical protein
MKSLSYHGYKSYMECPLKYFLTAVKHVAPTKYMDEYNFVFGSVIQKVFENFYNDELWRRGALARDIVKNSVIPIFNGVVRSKTIDWGKHDKGQDELLADCLFYVDKNVDVIRDHKLIGEYARSEVAIFTKIHNNLEINGRLDFLLKQNGKSMILDGKGNVKKNADTEQLYWYALLYLLRNKVLPDSLWFWYYRFPEDPLKKIDFDVPTLKALKDSVVEMSSRIVRNKFDATPSSKSCFWCPYSGSCKFEANVKNKILVEKGTGIVSMDMDD